MTNYNQLPSQEPEYFQHEALVQFDEGSALGFRTPGDRLLLGPESNHKYARHFSSADMAIIETESGNSYGIARGLVINRGQRTAYDLPVQSIDMTIGEPCTIPGVGTTTRVKSVMLRYRPGEMLHFDERVAGPSPFDRLDEQANKINALRKKA